MGANMTARFEVLRAFTLGGEIVRPGELVELEDVGLINTLLHVGRIAPADAATRRRISRPNPWTIPKNTSVSPRGVMARMKH